MICALVLECLATIYLSVWTGRLASNYLSQPCCPRFASHLCAFVIKLLFLVVSHMNDHVHITTPAFLTTPLLPRLLQKNSSDANHFLRRRFPKIIMPNY